MITHLIGRARAGTGESAVRIVVLIAIRCRAGFFKQHLEGFRIVHPIGVRGKRGRGH